MNLPTSLLRGSLAPPSPALWRSLAVSLSEKVAFEPELRREILKRLVTEWLDQPDFENETASLLKKLSEPASDLRESLLESLNAVGQGASPIIALWVLRLKVRLFGWPKTEATESEKILKELGTLLASTNPQGLPEEVIVGASELLIDAGLDEISSLSEGSRCLQFLRQLWQGRMLSPEGSVSDRTSAGVMAGLLGDVRPGVGIYTGAAKIPHFAWCGPGGEVSQFHTFSQAFPARRFWLGGPLNRRGPHRHQRVVGRGRNPNRLHIQASLHQIAHRRIQRRTEDKAINGLSVGFQGLVLKRGHVYILLDVVDHFHEVTGIHIVEKTDHHNREDAHYRPKQNVHDDLQPGGF